MSGFCGMEYLDCVFLVGLCYKKKVMMQEARMSMYSQWANAIKKQKGLMYEKDYC